ncbi:MAG: hypothetical protein ABI851_00080 [Saprospiraceae bacterium]
MNNIIIYGIFICFIFFNGLIAQIDTNKITLINPSFEGTPRCCVPPLGWMDCGWRNETPPDILPSEEGVEPLFTVTTLAFEGETYLGMVTRDNDSYERVVQKLTQTLRKDICYSFSIYLCRSKEYMSTSQKDPYTLIHFNKPIMLRIYCGDAYCHQKELLGESAIVDNSEWKKFSFEFKPSSDAMYIELEAFYDDPDSEPYNGNILLDNASDIVRINCSKEK